MIKASKCIQKSHIAYLVYALEERKLEDVPVVSEFPEVFPKDLPGLPPDRQIEFRIDLIPGAIPIAKTPYRLAPTEMEELRNQLRDLMDKGFIRKANELGTKVNLSTAYHPQTDGQSERTIQTLEDMLRACVIDFGGARV
ncbi:hypothetical protein QVD17_20354 [Tagetes erecta]|uniref:Reverse transcriptase domain-containing protein n=1 Tax=Tagetes erecta TaxID=13708 RepID=A0AAD8NXT9_TARER|nr:hypothetical protein QVD17_20354 [Tagetes erecta]